MHKAILILLLSLLFISCGKNKEQLQNNQNVTDNSGIFYPIKNVGDQQSQGYFYDFTWSENGKEKKLSDYKGKVILLNFWATWCAPCRKEIPGLSQIALDRSENKDFVMIGISIDQSLPDLDRFVKMYPLPYPILHDDGTLITKYTWVQGSGSTAIPQTFIINKDGKVVECLFGARSKEDFEKILNKYL